MTAQEITAKLQEAQDALHMLLTNKQAVSMSMGGRTITYSIQEKDELEQYIGQLRAQLATVTGGTARRRPFGVTF